MTKIEITKTELVWPGKYNDDGTRKETPRVSLPFQVIETVNESRATREARKTPRTLSLFDVYEGKEGETFEEGWKNKLIWGDNLLVMGSLLEKFAGKIDLIYIDPPFATGADFSLQIDIGEQSILKEASSLEEKAYRDTWGQGISSYLDMLFKRLILMQELLSEKGSIFVHLDYHVSHSVKMLMDDVFGQDNFRNEIIVKRRIVKNLQQQFESIQALPWAHDVILWYTKTTQRRFRPLQVPYETSKQDGYWHHFWSNADRPTMRYELLGVTPKSGQWKWAKDRALVAVENYKRYLREAKGRSLAQYWEDTNKELEFIRLSAKGKVENWFPPSEERIANTLWLDIHAYENEKEYATQKHTDLLNRVIEAASEEGDLVADFFCGSGTTLAVAEKLGRRWIGCDLSRFAIHTTRKRLLEIENCKPFEILNLGKYERQYWQGVTFGDKGKTVTEKALYDYLTFVLKLYGAQPVAGLQYIHGKKGKALVHIGAVDAPVTIDEINAALAECVALKQTELHVLGWEWEMGLYDLMVAEAKKQGVKLLLLQIPREVMEQQAVDKGDIQFFELAYLEVEIKKPKKLTAQVTLKDFVIPNTELIPDDVRAKIKKWSDYVDYWAVDWDFQNDTFMQGWVTYRTRKDRTLALTSDPHTYEKAGKYRLLVKVIDIFGNDTSQAFEVEVK